jgi:hypothetical protein
MAERLARLLLLAALLSGCAPVPTAAPTPSPLHIVTTPALEGVIVEWIQAYRAQGHVQPFELETHPFDEAIRTLQAGRGEILITSHEPPSGWFAAPLKGMPIAVIVHSSVDIRNLSIDQLRRIFSGAEATWEELGGGGRPIQAVVPPRGDELRRRFEQVVMGGAAVVPDAYLAPSPAFAGELIAEHEGAVGFMPDLLTPDDVQTVRVEGRLPDAAPNEDGYPLMLSILAMSPQEPRGALADWLIWLQNEGIPRDS